MSKGESEFRLGQRVHSATDSRRVGTVCYLGPVQGYAGDWIGVDWDAGDGKHDGSINGVRYFTANSDRSASCVRAHNLSHGVSLLEALRLRYRGGTTQEDEDEMYVLSASNKRVSVELLGKDKLQDKLSRFEELTGISLSFLGISSPGVPAEIASLLPSLKHLDLTGNLLTEWKDIGTICEALPILEVLNLSYNLMVKAIVEPPRLRNIRTLVLNNTGVNWKQVEILKASLQAIEELHLMGNGICTIDIQSSLTVKGFDSLTLLNLEQNCITDWKEILKLSQLRSLEQLHLNKNSLSHIFYPSNDLAEFHEKSCSLFENLSCLLLGSNNIEDAASIHALNFFPKLVDVRLSDNPITDTGTGGLPRFVLIGRLSKIEILNGSEIKRRERKESEIRYVRVVMSKFPGNHAKIQTLHPRFTELKECHGIDDEKPISTASGPQKMASGLLSLTLKCVGSSMGEKAPQTKKLPGSTTVGKLKFLCETFFKLKSLKLKLFLQEEGSPLRTLLNDEMAALVDLGVGNGSTVLVDEDT